MSSEHINKKSDGPYRGSKADQHLYIVMSHCTTWNVGLADHMMRTCSFYSTAIRYNVSYKYNLRHTAAGSRLWLTG